MKWVKRILLILIVLFGVLWLGLFLAVKIYLPPQKIKQLVEENATKALEREVKIESASAGVFPQLHVSVKGLSLANAEGFSNVPLFFMREMVLEIHLFSLLKLSPVIKEIRLVEPSIFIEQKGEQTNLDGLGGEKDSIPEATPDTSSGPPDIPASLNLKSFRIINGKVELVDRTAGTNLSLGEINQNLAVTVDRDLRQIIAKGVLRIQQISVQDKKSDIKKGKINVKLNHDLLADLKEEKFTINNLEISLQDLTMGIKGSVTTIFDTPELDLTFGSQPIYIASLIKEVPQSVFPEIKEFQGKGSLKLSGKVKGKLDSTGVPGLNAQISFDDLGVVHGKINSGLTELNGDIKLTENSLKINEINFKVGKQPVSLSLDMPSLQPLPKISGFNLNGEFSLNELVPLADALGILPDGFDAKGSVNIKAKAAGIVDPQNPDKLQMQANMKLVNLELKAAEVPKSFRLTGDISVNNKLIRQNVSGFYGESNIAIDSRLQNYLILVMPDKAGNGIARLNAEIISDKIVLDEIMGLSKGEKEKETAAPMTAFPPIPNLVADITIKIDETQYLNLAMTDFKSTVSLENDVVRQAMSGKLYSGGFSHTMTADLSDTTNAQIKSDFKINKVEANDFLSRLNDNIPSSNKLFEKFSESDGIIFGKLSLDGNIETNGLPQAFMDNLTGTLDLKINDGRIMETGIVDAFSDALRKIKPSFGFGQLDFGLFTLLLEIRDGSLIVREGDIKSPKIGIMALAGLVGFDQALSLEVTHTLTSSMSKIMVGASSAATKGLAQVTGISELMDVQAVPTNDQGNVLLFFDVGGTLSQPKVSLDISQMKDKTNMISSTKEKLQEEAEKLKVRAEAEKRKLEEEARKKIEQEKQKVEEEKRKLKEKAEEEKRKAEEEAKRKAKEKAGKALKGLGF